MLYII